MRPLERWMASVGAVVLVTTGPAAYGGGLRLGLEGGVRHESNVNRAVSALAESDRVVELEGYAARSIALGAHSGFVTRFALRGEAHQTFDALDAISALGRFSWRYQPSLAYTGVWFELNGSAEIRRHRDSAIRDGELLSLGVGLGKHFSDRVRGSLGVSVDRRYASEGTVFDLSQQRLTGTLDWRLSPSATLYGGASWIHGDQVVGWGPASGGSTATAYRYSGRSDWYGASARDPAFDSTGRLFSAYRAKADTAVLDLGLNWAFNGQTALDVSITRFDARTDNGPSYDGYAVRASVLHRFP